MCCCPRGGKELDMIEQLKNNINDKMFSLNKDKLIIVFGGSIFSRLVLFSLFPLSINWVTSVDCCYCCSVTKSCPTLCDTRNCSTPGIFILHYLPEFAQTHVHWDSDAIQPSHPLLPPSPLALHFSQYQDLSQRLGFSHQVAKRLQL